MVNKKRGADKVRRVMTRYGRVHSSGDCRDEPLGGPLRESRTGRKSRETRDNNTQKVCGK